MLKIEAKQSVTLAQIIELAQAGKSVVQTPHVGNLPLDVLVALQSGLHVRLVDTNVGNMDKLFYPHLVIRQGQAVQVADPHTLVTHTTVTRQPADIAGSTFVLGRPLSSAHVEATRMAFPQADIISYADWLMAYRELILQFLEVITCLHPNIWERRVSSQGITENAQRSGIVPTWSLVMEQGICGITVPSNVAGWVLPNPVAILTDVFVDAACGRVEQYALSGPSMATYITQYHRNFGPMDKLLAYWYAELVRRLPKLNLPERFMVRMVPAASWQLAVPMHLKDCLDALVCGYFDYKRHQVDLSQAIALGVLRNKQVGRLRGEQRQTLVRIAKPIRQWLVTQSTPAFATQYDVLMSSEPLYVHPIVHNTSVKSLADVVAFLRTMLSV